METMLQVNAYGLQGSENERRLLAMTYTVSAIGHLLLFIILVFGPGQMPSRKYVPSVVNVNLVSLPSLRPGPAAEPAGLPPAKPAEPVTKPEKPVVKEAPKKAPVTPETAKKAVSLAPQKWKEKTSLKEKTFKPEKVVKSAIKRLEKTAEASKPDPLATALDRLREKVEKSEKADSATGVPGGTAGSRSKNQAGQGAGSGLSGGGGLPGVLTTAILLYQRDIHDRVRNNWVFSEELAGARSDLETRLMVKIMANGEIKDVWFEKRSGNRYLDDSAYKAVMKSNPLPPLPKGYKQYNVGFIFTPSGLQKDHSKRAG